MANYRCSNILLHHYLKGSSAGAGSEVYHVYRHLRRREVVRQEYIAEQAEKEQKDKEFLEEAATKKLAAEAKTAKKRAKRYVNVSHNLGGCGYNSM